MAIRIFITGGTFDKEYKKTEMFAEFWLFKQ